MCFELTQTCGTNNELSSCSVQSNCPEGCVNWQEFASMIVSRSVQYLSLALGDELPYMPISLTDMPRSVHTVSKIEKERITSLTKLV